MRRMLIVNNIPTPYRAFMYKKLYEKGKEFGVEVTVAFQARREARRPWRSEDIDMPFPYFISKGLSLKKGKAKELFGRATLNLDILAQIRSGAYGYLMLLPAMSINNWVASLLPSRKSIKLLYSEANLLRLNLDYLPIRMFRRCLYSRFDASVCPGRRAFELIGYIAPSMKRKPVIWLPNIVDTSLFAIHGRSLRKDKRKVRQRLRLPKHKLIIIGVGITECKGTRFVIDAVVRVPGEYKILFLGDGNNKARLESQIRDLNLSERVSLVGQIPENKVVEYLAAADWFIHPAIYDSSPLACVEAVSIGLPLAVSVQTGNAPEIVREGVNGFTFNPTDAEDMIACLRRIVETPVRVRQAMQSASEEVAHQRFDPNIVANTFFEGILSIEKR